MKTTKKFKYVIVCDEDHIYDMMKALDSFSRLGAGQLDIVLDDICMNFYYEINKRSDNQVSYNQCIAVLKNIIYGLQSNSNYPIGSPKLNDTFKNCWDMYQVLRNRISWDKNPKGGYSLIFDPPLKTSKKTLIKITKVEKKEK